MGCELVMKRNGVKSRLAPLAFHQPDRVQRLLKARQAAKIKQLGDALVAAGYRSLDRQAKALGLSRSTTWTILKANHKSSGLFATIVKRMLVSPNLPPRVRQTLCEYIEEKRAGLYGDAQHRVRRFAKRIENSIEDATSPE